MIGHDPTTLFIAIILQFCPLHLSFAEIVNKNMKIFSTMQIYSTFLTTFRFYYLFQVIFGTKYIYI